VAFFMIGFSPLTLPGLSPFAGREPKAFTIHFYERNANGFR
jgi:hypothetical protein